MKAKTKTKANTKKPASKPAARRAKPDSKTPRASAKSTDAKPKSWGHGGWRPGAGRKPAGDIAGASHRRREELAPRLPMHLSVPLGASVPKLRNKVAYAALCGACASGCDLNGFRLVHFAVHDDALHLLVEADDHTAMTRGAQGLLIRIARAVNRAWQRSGKLYGDRYQNRVVHDAQRLRELAPLFADGAWVDGAMDKKGRVASEVPLVARPRTALLKSWGKR